MLDNKMNAKLNLKTIHSKALALVGQLSLATTEQVNTSLYSKGSLTTTAAALLELYNHRYLDRIAWRVYPLGNPRWVWKLKARGHRYLTREIGMVPSELIRPSDNLTKVGSPLHHAIECNDLIVKTLQLARTDPNLVVRFKAEPQLRHEDFKRKRADGPNIPVIPDTWVHIARNSGQAPLWFELDPAHIPIEKIKERLHHYLEIDQSDDYRAIFGTKGLVIVFAVSGGGSKRRDRLMQATEELLKSTHKERQGDLFRFGLMDDKGGEDFYFNPTRWYVPFSSTPSSLLPLSWWRPK